MQVLDTTATTECTECGVDMELTGVVVGETLQCAECSAELEIISLSPVELALAPNEVEDWGE